MTRTRTLGTLAAVVGFLAFVEFTSGVLQGYYTPMLSDIARHLGIHDADVNWLEGTQLMLSALVVPAFAKLGDMVGHKRMLLISTALTAAAALVLPFTDSFALFLIGWTLMGFYVVWLPLEIALIWSRSRHLEGRASITAKAAGLLVAALEGGAIIGALAGGALIDVLPLTVVLLIPALLIVVCFFVILFGVTESPEPVGGVFDTVGVILISLALICFTGGLSLLRLEGGLVNPLSWGVVLLGILLVVPFVLWELRNDDPLIDVRMFRSPALGPVFLTAGLFGVSVLGAQAPLSTFARTDPEMYGYGLGTTGFATSLIIGIYLIGMIVGALLFPVIARALTPRVTLMGASVLVGVGFLLFLPFHHAYAQVITNMVVVGLGSGALVAALPAAAASAAPATQTGVATGLTNSVKTVGGAIASCVFGIALLNGAAGAVEGTAGSFAGYVTVWVVCGVTALIAAVLLVFVPKTAFTDRADAEAAVEPVL
ncbi:MFS transporter [Microbacterium hydrocarbonoxydans]|uniref:MFS transporter n=1 Tax=Microbacterium hydrocarbonoxydans TaxID=273678 RepID=UPI00203D8BB7|nr:MFS transporter [Microbacterium hydrocarbonoxydans]MCM3781168.1 MFS transporter [Microbacterium hydrocarbonoxydans]